MKPYMNVLVLIKLSDNTLPLITDSCKDEALHECLGTHKAFTADQIIEPRSEKTGLRGFRQGPTQTGLYNDRRWLEA